MNAGPHRAPPERGAPELRLQPSREMKIELLPEQEGFLSGKDAIRQVIQENPDTVLAYDIFAGDAPVGFALLRRFEPGGYFLWDYAVDRRWQGRGLGARALRALIDRMIRDHGLKQMTTTYIWGNGAAKRLYERVGFAETEVVDEPGVHEVNMLYRP